MPVRASSRSLFSRGVIPPPPPPTDWGAFDSVIYTQLPSLAGTGNKDRLITHAHSFNMVGGYGINNSDPAGSRFAYNDYGVAAEIAAMKVIFGGVTNFTTPFNTYLGTPLGINDHTPFADGTRLGGGFIASPHDFARIALFWMKQGNWNGTQLLPQSFFTERFDQIGVPNATPMSSAVDGVGDDYAGFGTFGGGINQVGNGTGPGLYSYGVWHGDGTKQETGLRPWPDAPTSLRVATGSGGSILLYVPDTQLILLSIGDWGDLSEVEDQNFNARMNLVNDMVTGSPSYAEEFPGATWTTATDAQAGLSTATIDSLITAIGGSAATMGVIIRNGRLVREWSVDPGEPYGWASISKPVLATLLAFGIADGLL